MTVVETNIDPIEELGKFSSSIPEMHQLQNNKIITKINYLSNEINLLNSKCIFKTILIGYNSYEVMVTQPSITLYFSPNINQSEKINKTVYFYGGNYFGHYIYYTYDTHNNMYGGENIHDIGRYITVNERKNKIEKLNEVQRKS